MRLFHEFRFIGYPHSTGERFLHGRRTLMMVLLGIGWILLASACLTDLWR
jgi:hypothetical protein